MKSVLSNALIASALVLSSTMAHAVTRTLDCVIGVGDFVQGHAQIEVLPVENDPTLHVFKAKIQSEMWPQMDPVPRPGIAEIVGNMVGHIDRGQINMVGYFHTTGGVFMNPQSISFYGQISEGIWWLRLYDEDRLFHGGYGTNLKCQVVKAK